MFEQALILRAGLERNIDVGLLAETLFFYGSTHLLLDSRSVLALARKIPSGDLMSLLDRDSVKVSYIRQNFGVVKAGMPPVHDFGAFIFHGTKAGEKPVNFRGEIEVTLERGLGKTAQTKKLARAIADRVKLHKFSGIPEREKAILDLVRSDVRDPAFLEQAIAKTMRHLVPTYSIPKNFYFRLFDTGQGFAVETNLDFSSINQVYHQNVPIAHSSIDSSYLLSHLLEARSDSFFGAYYMAEPVTAPIYSDIIRLKHFDFLRRRDLNAREAEQFQDIIVPDFPSIRETMNQGTKTFSEFFTLLDKADKFKNWIQTTNPDVGLVQNYHRAATEKTWADRLPSKSIRFAVATGIGLAAEALLPSGLGITLGVGAGAADSLLLDRIIKGWRPNQFIEGPYREFVDPKQPLR
jgi:hypothetical protein